MIFRRLLFAAGFALAAASACAQSFPGTSPQPVTRGGTGATDAATAISNLASISPNSLRIGSGALAGQTGGSAGSNVAIGPNAGASIADGDSLTAVGASACGNVVGGRTATCLGNVSGQYSSGTASNTFIGAFAGRSNDTTPLTGSDNTGVGEAALIFIQGDANFNTGVGFNSLFSLLDGDGNVAVGDGACLSLTTALNTLCYGNGSYKYGNGSNNTILGFLAMQGVTGDGGAGAEHAFTTTNGVIIPGQTVIPVTTASIFSVGGVAEGGTYLYPNTHVLSVNSVANTITVDQGAFGNFDGTVHALTFPINSQHTGAGNTAVGRIAISNISGAAANDTAIGDGSCGGVTSGSNNTCIGRGTGTTLTTGSDNVLIGNLTDVPTATTSNYFNLGNVITGFGIGNATTGDDFVGISQATPIYTLDVNGTIASRGTSARLLFQRNTLVTALAPGAGNASLSFVCGTNSGTLKLVAVGGTSTTRQTILDNIGAGVTGC